MSDDPSQSAAAYDAAADFYSIPEDQDLLQQCLDESIQALSFSGFVSEAEQESIRQRFFEDRGTAKRRLDVIECLVKVRHGEDATMADMTEDLSYVASLYLAPSPILVPFVPSISPPNNFYEKHPKLEALSKLLLAPIIFAEDTDVIGVTSLNAVAAEIVGEEVKKYLHSRIGSEPYITVTRIDYRGWANLLNSHFNL